MEPEIVEMEDMKVVGYQTLTTHKCNLIPKLWDRLCPAREDEIKNKSQPEVWLGVSFRMEKLEEDMLMFHLAGAVVDEIEDVPEGMTYRHVDAGKYAKFTHKGPLAELPKTYDKIYREWLPNSEYEYGEADEYEWYDDRFEPESEDSELDIYVPVK